MVVLDLLNEKREAIIRIAERHGASNVRVFGSSARGDVTDESDIDLLVDVTGDVSPWFPASLVEDLEKELGKPVDVVTEGGLYWLLRRKILKEARPV